MKLLRGRATTLGFAGLSMAAIVMSAVLSQHLWRESGLRSLQAINEPRIELIASAVRSEINRQDHLPIVLSLDTDVRTALKTHDENRLRELSPKLQKLSVEADARALYVIGRDGIVVAAGQTNASDQFVGRDLSNRSYFLKAMESGRSSFLGIDPANDRIRYYLGEAIRDPDVLGVATIRIEFDSLEAIWGRGGERVLVTDADGVVFLSSDPAYKYRKIVGATAQRIATESAPPSYPEGAGKSVELSILEKRDTHTIVHVKADGDEQRYLYDTFVLPEFGWTVHRFVDLAVVHSDERDGLIIGAAISGILILLLLYVVQRTHAYRAAKEAGALLQMQVAERTRELRDANALLQTEVDERRRTEARLRSAQNELVQAGKLAALGQMSAAIAHEVNQPLAAIRTFMASTKVFAERGETKKVVQNLGLIDGLAERMASITNHLKSFARKSEPGRPEPVDVARAIEGALFLIGSQLKSAGVRVTQEIEPDLWVSGYAIQLEQVLVNLIRNALDAVAETKKPEIGISVRAIEDTIRIAIADNGPGIAPELIDRIFDPFVTSKPVGKGLGLGLSITYGIVQDFRGRMSAANRPDGGAELVVELPLLKTKAVPQETAAHA